MKRSELIILAIILLVSATLSVSILKRGHLWWDDFASYIMQAQSLLEGHPWEFIEHNRFTIDNSSYPPGPVAYPWGFPILLAPVLAVFGIKILALKLLNTAFFLAFLVVFHLLARRRLPSGWALALTAIAAFNPALLTGHDLILSDIPFLFFSTLAILLIESLPSRVPVLNWLLIGVVIFVSFNLRTNGVLLLVPLLAAQVLRTQSFPGSWKNPVLILPYLVFAGLALLQFFLLPGGQESYFSHFSMLSPHSLIGNAAYYAGLPAELTRDIPLGMQFLWLMVLLFIFDLITNFRSNLVGLSYSAATLSLFITWPETQGLRFIYPILPLLLLMTGEGLWIAIGRLSGTSQTFLRWAGDISTAALIMLSLAVSAREGWANLRMEREINGPFDPVSSEMFQFIRSQTSEDSVIIFFKPRAMRLLTNRDSFMTQRCEDLPKGDYLVIHEKQGSNGQIGDLSTCPGLDYPVIFDNRRFTVYEVEK